MFSTTPQSAAATTAAAKKFFFEGKISGAFHSRFISFHFILVLVSFSISVWHRNFMVVVIFIVIHNDDIFGFSRSVSNKLNERKHIYCAFHLLYLCDDDEEERNRAEHKLEWNARQMTT